MQSSIEVFQSPWENKLLWKIKEVENSLILVCPYIKRRIAELIIATIPQHTPALEIKILTRFDYNDFLSGASDFEAVELLHNYSRKGLRKEIRFVNNLHSKIYFFDQSEVIISSSNLTTPGLNKNIEIALSIFDSETISSIYKIVMNYWKEAESLTDERFFAFEKLLFEPKLGKNKEIINQRNKEIIKTTIDMDPKIATLLLDKAIAKPQGLDDEKIGIQPLIKANKRSSTKQRSSRVKVIEVVPTAKIIPSQTIEIDSLQKPDETRLTKKEFIVGNTYKGIVKDIFFSRFRYVQAGQTYYGKYTVIIDINGTDGILLFFLHPKLYLSIDDYVDVKVVLSNADMLLLELPTANQTIGLIAEKYPIGSMLSGIVRSVAQHITIKLDNNDNLSGLMGRDEYDWLLTNKDVSKKLKPGTKIEGLVIGYVNRSDSGLPYIYLSRKQLFQKPKNAIVPRLRKAGGNPNNANKRLHSDAPKAARGK